MIPVSTEYRRQLTAGNRNWLIKVDMTLADNTVLHLTNEHIWDNGITLDNAISSDNSFDIGSAIVSSLKVVINNINGDYSQYDFDLIIIHQHGPLVNLRLISHGQI